MEQPRNVRHTILVVGAADCSRERIEIALVEMRRYGSSVRASFEESLPDEDLTRCAAVLIDAYRPAAEWMRVSSDPDMKHRARVLIDTRVHRAYRLSSLERRNGGAVIVVGSDSEESSAQAEFLRLLHYDPVISHLSAALEAACSAAQRRLIQEFIRRSDLGSASALAKALARSRRSLDRDCARLGLNQPRVILQTARIALGLTSMSKGRISADRAAILAGYSQASAFRRAARRALGAPVSVLLSEWHDAKLVEARLRRTLLRES